MVNHGSEPSQKQEQLGPYRLGGIAGRGGMATVYDATDARDGRRVAVKVLAYVSEQSPEERNKQETRLRREALAISRIKHPHIVEMFDVEISSDNSQAAHYLVMEYVEGETLKSRLYRYGSLPPQTAVVILEQIGSALDAVHSADIVHRDIKPSNIMLLPNGAAKLMDFGVARLTDDTMVTRTGMVVGSPAYMSPEQATSQPVGPASDLWSLTSVFYEALAGQPAFRGDSIPAVLYQVAYGQAAPLPPHRDPETQRIFERFQPVFTRAFEREPAARFGSAGELAAAFRAALEGKEAQPAPVPAAPVHAEREAEKISPQPSLRITRWAPAILIPVFLLVFALNTWWAARARNLPQTTTAPANTSSLPAGKAGAASTLPIATSTAPPMSPPTASIVPVPRDTTPLPTSKKPTTKVVTRQPSAKPKAKRITRKTPRKRSRTPSRRTGFRTTAKNRSPVRNNAPPARRENRSKPPTNLYSPKTVLPPRG